MELQSLISALKAATEGTRGLDYHIHEAIGWQDNDECGWSKPATGERTADTGWPHYTTSLDAALTLVPEGWGWAAAELDKGEPSAVVTNFLPQLKPGTLDANPDRIDFRSKAATHALALCIAALKARLNE